MSHTFPALSSLFCAINFYFTSHSFKTNPTHMKTLGLALLNIRYFSFYFLLWLCTLTLHGVVVYIALPFAIIPTSSSSFTSLLFLKFIWAPVVHQTIDEFLRFSLAYIHYLFASNYNLIQYFLFVCFYFHFFFQRFSFHLPFTAVLLFRQSVRSRWHLAKSCHQKKPRSHIDF